MPYGEVNGMVFASDEEHSTRSIGSRRVRVRTGKPGRSGRVAPEKAGTEGFAVPPSQCPMSPPSPRRKPSGKEPPEEGEGEEGREEDRDEDPLAGGGVEDAFAGGDGGGFQVALEAFHQAGGGAADADLRGGGCGGRGGW